MVRNCGLGGKGAGGGGEVLSREVKGRKGGGGKGVRKKKRGGGGGGRGLNLQMPDTANTHFRDDVCHLSYEQFCNLDVFACKRIALQHPLTQNPIQGFEFRAAVGASFV